MEEIGEFIKGVYRKNFRRKKFEPEPEVHTKDEAKIASLVNVIRECNSQTREVIVEGMNEYSSSVFGEMHSLHDDIVALAVTELQSRLNRASKRNPKLIPVEDTQYVQTYPMGLYVPEAVLLA